MSDAVRVGVEVGGTFTDLVAFEAGSVRITKVPSTPAAPHPRRPDSLHDGSHRRAR